MNNREIKFRIWDNVDYMTSPFTLYDIQSGRIKFTKNGLTIMQFTGLHDKSGVEIYEGDLINYAKKESWCKNEKCETKHKLNSLENFCPSCGNKIESTDFIRTAEIRFVKGGFCFYEEQHEYYNITFTAWQTFINEMYIEWTEVIGNIYEHKNLIK